MKRLLKISDEHYIIIDSEASIDVNDWYFTRRFGLGIENNSGETKIERKSEGYVRISHSTKPLSKACRRCNGFCEQCIDRTKPLELKDVLIVTREKPSFIELRIAELQKLIKYARDQFSKGLIESQILYWNQLLNENEQKYSEEEIDVVLNGWTNEVYFGHVRTNLVERLQENKKPKTSWDVDFDKNNKLKLI